jgi:ActR/RegA family two-component response regulator
VLDRAEWNVTRAGRMLGMHRNAVQRLMDKRGIKRDKTRP